MVASRIALRFLRFSRLQTIFIIVGIAVGISVQVFVGTLLTSLQQDLVERTVGNSPHITISPKLRNETIDGWQSVVRDIKPIGGIKSVSVSADSPALIRKGTTTASVLMRGFIFEDADKIYDLNGALYEGSVPTTGQLLVGKELKEELGLSLGDDAFIIIANGSATQFTVSGFYDLGVSNLNRQWVLTTLGATQQLFDFDDKVTVIEIQVLDVFAADKVADEVSLAVPNNDLVVNNWKEQNRELLSGLQAQSGSSFMIQTFVLLSVLIGIASVLAITVVQKSRQIGILKAMGIKDRTASLVFVYQGLVLGIGGAFAGVLLGVLLLIGFSSGTSILEIRFDPLFLFMSGLLAVIVAVVAAAVPARKSSRLNPIEVIRGG